MTWLHWKNSGDVPGRARRRPRIRRLGFILATLLLACQTSLHAEPSRSKSTVGMPAKIEQLVLPGPELEAKPIEDRRAPLVLRVVESYAHGSAFRYDIVYYGLEPGAYDLRD